MVTIGPIPKTGPSTTWYMDATQDSVVGNASRVRITLRCYNGGSGNTSSYFNGAGNQLGIIDGVGTIIAHSRSSAFLPSGYAQNQLRWSDTAVSGLINHDAAGNLNVTVRMRITYGTINEDHTAVLSLPRIPKVPSKPSKPVFLSVSTTTITYSFANAGDNGGSAQTTSRHQVATNAGFTTGVQTWDDGSSPTTTPALAPGTQHYIRYAAVNAVGAGPWSDTLTQTTLPAVAPGLTVTPLPTGGSAKLSFFPPGGVTGVDHYTWERRPAGSSTTNATADTQATITTVSGLTPGNSYEWRGSAWVGSYQSPWTGWITAAQPKPNTAPGDYFDGGSDDAGDLDYAWTGTANLSSSTATAPKPLGWVAGPNGGTATVSRIIGGSFGQHAARVTIVTDSTGIGGRFGQWGADPYAADISGGGAYVGSLYVRLSRQNRVAAELNWYDASHTIISRTPGDSVLVPAGELTRLFVSGTAPDTAEFAAIKVVDVAGTGSSLWQGGDVIDMDAAMISIGDLYDYFDGDTVDDADYTYAWRGTANASESTRTPVPVAPETVGTASLVDPDCAVVPLPPRPPVIANACITETGVWKRSYGAIPASAISDWLAVIPTFEIVTLGQVVRQVRIRIYENPDALPSNQVATSSWISEQIVSFVPANTTLTLDGVSQRAWAEVAGGGAQSANHLLYGSNGSPATWPILSCGIPYVISVDIPLDVDQAGSRIYAYLTTRT